MLEVLKEVMWSGPSAWLILGEKIYSLFCEKEVSLDVSGLLIHHLPRGCVGGDSHFLAERSKPTRRSEPGPQLSVSPGSVLYY